MSAPEDALAWHLTIDRVPAWEREYRFAPPRRWRFDFAWPDRLLAVEVDGGTWVPGSRGHGGGTGFARDAEKLNEAALRGWRVLRVTPQMIRDGRALALIERALG